MIEKKRFKKFIIKHYESIEELAVTGSLILFLPFIISVIYFYEYYPLTLIDIILFVFCLALFYLVSDDVLWRLVKDADGD